MNGLDKITNRIQSAADEDIKVIMDDAYAQAKVIEEEYIAKAEKRGSDLMLKATKEAKEREDRLVSVSQMQARQIILAAKQEVVGQAFIKALEILKNENVEDCETQLRLRKPEISVEVGKILFPEA